MERTSFPDPQSGKMALRIFFFGLSTVVALMGCATHDVAERLSLADRIAAQHQFAKRHLRAGRFQLMAWIGPQKKSGVLHIYIEGDGLAWITRTQASHNPSPRDPLTLRLAVQDTQNAAYLSRPCQYVQLSKGGDAICQTRYWTSDRFAPEVIEAMNDAVTQLKQQRGAERLVLIGYSGGGAVAALVAAKRTDVSHLITVAGNLDHLAWTRMHRISELKGSLNPPDSWRALVGIPQTHFVGQLDNVVPIEVYQSYRKAFPEDANIRIEIVPHVDHVCCWVDIWPELLTLIQNPITVN
jgi:hypothetical protein